MTAVLYHNPRCSKSRATLALLKEHGVEPELVEYLKTPLDEAELRSLLTALKRPAIDLVRRKEPEFAAEGLSADSDEATLIAALARVPKLMERPVLKVGAKAAIGRPPEAVLPLIADA